MCGRMSLTQPVEAMVEMFGASPSNDLPNLPNYNICPTNQVCSVVSDAGMRRIVSMRWGFIPHWYKKPTGGPLLINARGETIADKPAFRDAARARRCLIPASGFYEWTKGAEDERLPWYIAPKEAELLAFAGVWQVWNKGDDPLTTCAIVTTEAGEGMSAIHHREPVVIARQDWGKWLGEEGTGAALLMRASPEGALRSHRVEPEVNSNRASGGQLILPLQAS